MSACQLDTSKLNAHLQASNGSSRGRPVVLVSCGSFNPPTIMHMRMFDLAADGLATKGLQVVGGFMSPVGDAYKKPGLAPGPQRVAMCQAAAADHPLVLCNAWEAGQEQYTRTLVVLRRMQAELDSWWQAEGWEGQSPRVMLLCGADVLLSMTQPGVWVQPEVLLQEFGAVCIERASSDPVPASDSTCLSPLQSALQEEGNLLHRHQHCIHTVKDRVINNISSTLVRQELAAGRSVRYLVPAGVLHYLTTDTTLYRASQQQQ